MDDVVLVYLLFSMWICVVVWAVFDISSRSHQKNMRKWAWTNLVIILPFLGLIIYLLVGRKNLDDH